MKRKHWLGALTVASLWIAASGANHAQDKKAQDTAALNAVLKDVINAGAKIFNEQGDHAGCFRLYQGSLMSVKPFLPPDMQKTVDTSFANADRLASYAERAFELRRALDDIRSKTKSADGKTKDVEAKSNELKGNETTPKVPKTDKGIVAGKVAYQGKPLGGGYSVTLVAADGKKVSSAIQKDGTFQFKAPIAPGDFRVVIEPTLGETPALKLPARYALEANSGLMIRVQTGKQQVELNLVK